jgi:hypothetical protein
MVEANALIDPKNSGVGFEIGLKLPVAGIVRIFIRALIALAVGLSHDGGSAGV